MKNFTRERYSTPIYIIIGFVIAWSLTSAIQYYNNHFFEPDDACKTSLRILYVQMKKSGVIAQSASSQDRTKVLWEQLKSNTEISSEEERYITLNSSSIPLTMSDTTWALLCSEDPQIAVKLMLIRDKNMRMKPSYLLFPQQQELAYCPYHHYVLLTNGEIVRK